MKPGCSPNLSLQWWYKKLIYGI